MPKNKQTIPDGLRCWTCQRQAPDGEIYCPPCAAKRTKAATAYTARQDAYLTRFLAKLPVQGLINKCA